MFSRFDFSFLDSITYTLYISFADNAIGAHKLSNWLHRPKLSVIRNWTSFITVRIRGPIKGNRFGARTTVNSRNVRSPFRAGCKRGTRNFSRSGDSDCILPLAA